MIVSDQESIIKGLTRKFLSPGIFHTKSLTPGKLKILKHQQIINTGCKITSIDEEGGLIDYGYDKFAKLRYSNKTLKQASAVFSWGRGLQNIKKFIHHNQKNLQDGFTSSRFMATIFDYWEKKKSKGFKKTIFISVIKFWRGFKYEISE